MWFTKKEHYIYPVEEVDVFIEQTTNYLIFAEFVIKAFIFAAVFVTGYKFLA